MCHILKKCSILNNIKWIFTIFNWNLAIFNLANLIKIKISEHEILCVLIFFFEILSLKEQQLFKGFAIFGTLGCFDPLLVGVLNK
ncbi:hypothetical protein BpHYR1_022382 [Brachionus plicatilis]|uniref:Uncharacterized protein n=1 Tax=Brachionus plicatilis TaxID=10195 RepID=A0A3M7T3K6_BRAPC|nr:hypothetical protein BpHYR1_022382 [Brachionus plicatilis]